LVIQTGAAALTSAELVDISQEPVRRVAATQMALDAQLALLPYVLAMFTVGLALLGWASTYAANGWSMVASLAVFSINLGAFYALSNVIRREAPHTSRRVRLHLLGGLLWVGAIGQISAAAMYAGPAREVLLLLAAGGAGACMFFAAPLMITLLVIGPLAAAGPLIGLHLSGAGSTTNTVAGALALAMVLSMVVNRILDRQFDLMIERNVLMEHHTASLAALERLAKSKSDLLQTFSHEVRNGLTGVAHVLAGAAGGAGRSAPSREQLSAALSASRDLIEVLDATLDNEIVEAGGLDIRKGPIDPVRILQDIAVLARAQAGERGLELTLHVEPALRGPDVGAVIGDAGRLRQILSYLVGNAIKYTPRGRVELRLRKLDDARVRFEIADTGPGMTAEELARAYEPFTRIERTSAGEHGAGLGLSLSRKIAALMDGEVAGDSAPGVGSCFWLDLPLNNEAKPAPAPMVEDDAAPQSSRSLKVLVADEDRLSRAMLRSTLEQLGHQVLQAQTLDRAADLLRACEVDLIVVGQSDGKDGANTAQVLDTDCPIIALIGEADEGEAWLTRGCRSVVRKPVTAQALARAVADATLPTAYPAEPLRERA